MCVHQLNRYYASNLMFNVPKATSKKWWTNPQSTKLEQINNSCVTPLPPLTPSRL